ncbi:MAG: STAS domain-containing protein [Solirubrobacterales bacterium]|nr:STAS domain-containing protein [Solirubrobacterales bacterium]
MNTDFSVEEHNQGGASVLAATGELDLRTSPELEDRLTQAFDRGAELVILDLRGIEFMDSTGLRVLLSAHQRAHESGRRFALVRGADQVERVLTLTGVRDLLTVVDAPEELLAAGDQPAESA